MPATPLGRRCLNSGAVGKAAACYQEVSWTSANPLALRAGDGGPQNLFLRTVQWLEILNSSLWCI